MASIPADSFCSVLFYFLSLALKFPQKKELSCISPGSEIGIKETGLYLLAAESILISVG
jgi:hypothetical protein